MMLCLGYIDSGGVFSWAVVYCFLCALLTTVDLLESSHEKRTPNLLTGTVAVRLSQVQRAKQDRAKSKDFSLCVKHLSNTGIVLLWHDLRLAFALCSVSLVGAPIIWLLGGIKG